MGYGIEAFEKVKTKWNELKFKKKSQKFTGKQRRNFEVQFQHLGVGGMIFF